LAKRDKLTQQQKRQIAKTQKQKISEQKALTQLGHLGEQREGVMVSRYGEQADVLDQQSGQTYRCFLRQHLGAPVPGDRITFRLAPNNQGVIESIGNRDSLLQRPSPHQGVKPVVANINRVFILVAPLPDFSAILLDRYLIAIENAGIDITIVANKWDLSAEIKTQSIEQQLALYHKLGYLIVKTSTKDNLGKAAFMQAAAGHSSILVGQSGVGKSSLINWLFPSESIATKMISENSRLGQHTTTASQLFCLSEQSAKDGFIIDSPGIREFGLWHLDVNQIASGFCEFRAFLGSCKYRDCKHINEPGCEVIKAVKEGLISEQRWKNYQKILANNLARP
jgi:ribosome biogenesis GTPase